jgi:hypothetical protein
MKTKINLRRRKKKKECYCYSKKMGIYVALMFSTFL